MHAIQATILVERGRIAAIYPNPHGVEIISEQGTHFYPHAWILSGLVDSHCHLYGLGNTLTGLSLYSAISAQECVQQALQYAHNSQGWIIGNGWNQELWDHNHFPHKEILDIAFPDQPVYLRRADGHAAWVNSKALEIAGITIDTPHPLGGSILMEDSSPTGILIDNAMNLVADCIPESTPEQIKKDIVAAIDHCSSLGLTEVHDMDVHPTLLPYYLEMAESGSLPIRIQSYIKAQNDEWSTFGYLPAGGEFMRLVGLKFFADGALGSRGAALLEQYSDAETKGLFLLQEEQLFEKAVKGLEFGWNISTHAIGDAANRMVINVYERLRQKGYASQDDILRIEHAQIVHPNDIHRISLHAIKTAIQPIHCISDASMAESRLGERTSYAYPWKTLIDTGLHPAGGSDFPIESGNPFSGISAFCNRIPFLSDHAWHSEQIIHRKQAILSYTQWAHESSGMDYRRGKLHHKFDADFTIIDKNIETCNNDELESIQVLATYTAGIRRFSHNT